MNRVPSFLREWKCLYCTQGLNKECCYSCWGEVDEQHYKIVRCYYCQKKNWIKVDFYGSGHDSLLATEKITLESIVGRVLDKH